MEFSNRYYASLLANSPEKAKEYLNNCQKKGQVTDYTEVSSSNDLKVMTDKLREHGVKVRPNFKPETIKAKYDAIKDL